MTTSTAKALPRQPRPVKNPKYEGAVGNTLNLATLPDPVTAVFHYPGHEGLEGLKTAHITINSHSAGVFGRAVALSTEPVVKESLPELRVPHSILRNNAFLRYTIVYEFLDGTQFRVEGDSPTYTITQSQSDRIHRP